MMRKVFKYPVEVANLPIGAKPLFGGVQNGEFFIWVEVDNMESRTELFDCQVYSTGHEIESDAYKYLNSIFDKGFVWHFYCRRF